MLLLCVDVANGISMMIWWWLREGDLATLFPGPGDAHFDTKLVLLPVDADVLWPGDKELLLKY